MNHHVPHTIEPVPPRPRVAVAYHFFPHYRASIIGALSASARYAYVFVGSRVPCMADEQSIKACSFAPGTAFVEAPCRAFFNSILWQPGLLRLALDPSMDAIIYLANVRWPCTWISALLARLTGKRVLFWTHGWIRSESAARIALRNSFYRISHSLLLYGNRAKAIALSHGFREANLHVIYNSLNYPLQKQLRATIDDECRRAIRSRLFADPDRPLAICSARLVKGKSLDLLMTAAALLSRRGLPVNILIVGSGPELSALSALAESMSLAVQFVGECYDEALLAQYFVAADFCVSPGNVGLTAIHSLGYGVPVVTHDNAELQMPESEALSEGRTGWLYHHDDVADLARAMAACMDALRGDGRSRVRTLCYEVCELHYTAEVQMRNIERALDATLARVSADEPG